MLRRCGQVLAAVLATAPVLAQSEDSVRYVFRPVVVEDSAVQAVIRAAPTATLSREELIRLPVTTVADAVQGIPGVFVRNYGGLGGLKTISVRGATASQTAIVLDGIRLNVVTNGLVDMGQLPTALMEQITIERGCRSAYFGANAIGGVVEMTLRTPVQSFSLTPSIGAFGERGGIIAGGLKLGTHMFGTIVDVQYTRGNYPFLFNEFGRMRRIERTNGDAVMASSVLQWRWHRQQWEYTMTALVRASERGAPGAVLQGAIENAVARLSDREAILLSRLEYATRDSARWTFRTAGRWFLQQYRDSLARFRGPGGANDRFSAFDGALVIEAPGWRQGPLHLVPKVEAYLNMLSGNLYRISSGTNAERLQLCGIVYAQWTYFGSSGNAVIVESALRGDWYSDVPSAVVGSLQGRWLWNFIPLVFRASIGTGYRPPSFNELYYQNFGSRDIRPERSIDVNAGWVLAVEPFQVELDGFVMWVRDQIIAIPRSAITWSVQNAGRVFSRGAELQARWQHAPWRTVFSGTYQQVTYDDPATFTYGKQVIYTPLLLGLARIEYVVDERSTMLIQANYLGKRYSQTDNAPSSALDAVTTIDISLRAVFLRHPFQITVAGEVMNVGDIQYAVISNFPMPGRSWRLRVTVAWDS